MKTKDHADLLAAAFAAHAVLQLVGVVIGVLMLGAFYGFASPEIFEQMRRDHTPEQARQAMGFFFALVFGLVFLLLFAQLVLNAFAAWGVWKRRSWAKVVGVISSVLAVMSVPLGTALGVYGFWFLLGDRGREWFGAS